jgi:hypothetical protein
MCALALPPTAPTRSLVPPPMPTTVVDTAILFIAARTTCSAAALASFSRTAALKP